MVWFLFVCGVVFLQEFYVLCVFLCWCCAFFVYLGCLFRCGVERERLSAGGEVPKHHAQAFSSQTAYRVSVPWLIRSAGLGSYQGTALGDSYPSWFCWGWMS